MLGNESILAVDYRIDGDTLYRYHRKAVEKIVPWGPQAGAWRVVAGVWEPFVPDIDVTALEQNAWHPGTTRWPGWRRRMAACLFLVERWPEEARDGVRGFPSAHWQMLQLVNIGGAAAIELLRSNPALGYLAAMAGAASQIGLRRRALAALFGFPETEHAVRLLRKVPTAWISCEFLAELRAAMTHDRDAEDVLTHLARINPIALEVARDPRLRTSVAPDCIARLSRIRADAMQSDLIAGMRNVLEDAHSRGVRHPRIRTLADLDRPLGPARLATPAAPCRPARPAEALAFPAPSLPDAALPGALPPEPIPRFPDLNQPVRVAVTRPRRRTDALEFPAPPMPDLVVPGAQICAIRSYAELIAEGNVMRHCAGRDKSYARRVAAGSLYFYRMREPERLTIAIRPAACAWIVEEIRGYRNGYPGEYSRMLVANWLWQTRDPAPVAPANQLSFDFGTARG